MIEEVKTLADIENVRVVEYRKPFSLASMLSGRSAAGIPKIDRTTLYEMSAPQILYLWSLY